MAQSSGLSRNSIISELYQNGRINYLISIKAPKGLADDFKQELFLIISEMPDVRLFQLYRENTLILWICRIILNMSSKKGRFTYKYRDIDLSEYVREQQRSACKTVDQSVISRCNDLLKAKENGSPDERHEALLFYVYSEFKSVDAAARYFNVPKYHAERVIKKIKNELRSFIRNSH